MPDYEVRKQRALRRLRSDNPACCHCGHSDWRSLQLHHIAGKVYDPMTVIVCANCHAALSDLQGDHPTQIGDAPSMLECIGRLLINLADFFGQLAPQLKEFGHYLLESERQIAADDGRVQ
jgi:hypothetical protein